jgi:hypothetical protein
MLVVSQICYGGYSAEGLENEAREAKKDLWVELSVVGVAEPYKPQVVRSIRIAGSIHSLLDPERSNRILKTSAAGDGPLSIGT